MPMGTGGEGREAIGVPAEAATGQKKFQILKNRGEPLAKFWSPGAVRPPAPSQAPARWYNQIVQ